MRPNQALIFISFCIGIGIATACGGTTNSPGSPDAAGSGSSSGSASGSSSGGSSGGTSSSGSGGGAMDAAAIIPPGTTPGSGTVPCGAAMCTAPDVCCTGGGGAAPMCSALTACNSAGNDSYTCTGQANCAAPLVCCVTFGMRGANDVSGCRSTCGGGNMAQVCQTDAECPSGTTCRLGGGAGAGIMVCQPPLIPAGTTPGAGAVTCGGATCNAPNVCCSGGGGGGLMCSSLSACDNAGNDSYTCTGQANCTAPLICCVTYGAGGGNDVSVCQSTCTGGNRNQVCQANTECPTGMVCRAGGQAPRGITICRPPPMMTDAGMTGTDAAIDSASPPPDTGVVETGVDAPTGGG